MFAVLEEYKGELGICVKVGTLLQGVFLDDPRFFRTPYIGKHGWVTLRVYAARLNWSEIRELVKGSYDLVAPMSAKKRSGRERALRNRLGTKSRSLAALGMTPASLYVLPGSRFSSWSACWAIGVSGYSDLIWP